MQKRAIIYIRVSTEREEMQSPENQLFACAEYAKRHGLRIVGEPVEDLDLTGRSFAKRRITEIIERVRSGEADVVLVWKWSRFGRNNLESQINIRELEKAGGHLIAVTEDFDTTTTHGRFSRDNMLLVAELQSGIIGDTWKDVHANRHRNGLPHTGQPRFGYQRCPDCKRSEDDPKRYTRCECGGVMVVDPVRGPALGEAYERLAAGESLVAVALDMHRRGIRSLRGTEMRANQWRHVLDSGFGAGLIRWRSPELRRKYGARQGKPSTYDHWEPGKHDPVISLETWERYKALREDSSPLPWSTAGKYAYSGLVRCMAERKPGQPCGRKMIVGYAQATKAKGGVRIFRCPDGLESMCPSVTVTYSRVEAAVMGWLDERARGNDLGVIAMKRAAQRDRATSGIPEVEAELAAKGREKDRLLDLYLKELVSEEDFRNKREEVEAELTHLTARLSLLRRQAGEGLVPSAKDFGKLAEILPKMEPTRMRAALGKVIGRIDIIKTPGKKPNLIQIIPTWEMGQAVS
jgi:site-specific DNA recombinase